MPVDHESRKLLTIGRNDLLRDGGDDQFRNMVHNLLALSARLEQIRNRFGSFIGLSGPQYTMLVTVRQVEGEKGIGIRGLSNYLSLSPPFVTVETTKLVQAGILEKRSDPDDLRRIRLTVSPSGIALLERLAPMQRDINNLLFSPVTAADFDQICELTEDLGQSADQALRLSDQLLTTDRSARKA
ncbi:MarR family winged helix-turn-helix transcriptional regulator [Roseovarius sp. Pro17]|uniref:MarR family winged helix-turn-helix transcriptional regulator n=1 Tax=Roseovarius sp. Pro17 TaxID=3108175 RepID=UPI002D794AB4|nr:MarR family transcriptional regulator [Roseovarius sp. Pro17]